MCPLLELLNANIKGNRVTQTEILEAAKCRGPIPAADWHEIRQLALQLNPGNGQSNNAYTFILAMFRSDF